MSFYADEHESKSPDGCCGGNLGWQVFSRHCQHTSVPALVWAAPILSPDLGSGSHQWEPGQLHTAAWGALTVWPFVCSVAPGKHNRGNIPAAAFWFFFPNFSPVCRSTWKGGRYVVAVRDTKQRSAVPVAVFGALAYVIASDVN